MSAGGPGVVAVGSDGQGEDVVAAVWTSPDGITWSRVPLDEAVFGGTADQVTLGVTAGGPVWWQLDRTGRAVMLWRLCGPLPM